MAKVYLTYDLEESGLEKPFEEYHGAKLLPIQAEEVVRWEVGEFKRAWGRDVYGVRIDYRPEGRSWDEKQEIIEVPANAQNVTVHVGSVPEMYRPGLKEAA